jgi:hypothetical protein
MWECPALLYLLRVYCCPVPCALHRPVPRATGLATPTGDGMLSCQQLAEGCIRAPTSLEGCLQHNAMLLQRLVRWPHAWYSCRRNVHGLGPVKTAWWYLYYVLSPDTSPACVGANCARPLMSDSMPQHTVWNHHATWNDSRSILGALQVADNTGTAMKLVVVVGKVRSLDGSCHSEVSGCLPDVDDELAACMASGGQLSGSRRARLDECIRALVHFARAVSKGSSVTG